MTLSFTVSNIILHVALLAFMIGALFFLYTKSIERKVITMQVDRLVSDFTSDIKILLSDDESVKMQEAFQNLQPPDMTKQDEEANSSNQKLLKNASIMLLLTLIPGIATVGIISWLRGFSFLELLKENITVLLVACSIEILFISLFARNYRSLDANVVKTEVVKSMSEYANQ